jgi:hypothetical protein
VVALIFDIPMIVNASLMGGRHFTRLFNVANFSQPLNPSHTDSHSTNGLDDVHYDPPSGIGVLIVGAGVGDLVAALECHRKGHSVRSGSVPSPPSLEVCLSFSLHAMRSY